MSGQEFRSACFGGDAHGVDEVMIPTAYVRLVDRGKFAGALDLLEESA
jgi:hypothetical protein